MGAGVGKPVEFRDRRQRGSKPSLHIQLLGSLTITRDGVAIALPTSRKARALLAYLALAPKPVGRSRLCELLWSVPNDPRGELRWCLSKIRRILDEPGLRRVETVGDTIRLNLSDCCVDVAEVVRVAEEGIETLDTERLRALSRLFAGEFLDGLEISHSPHYEAWLVAERRQFRDWNAMVLKHLLKSASDSDALALSEKWLEIAPFDQSAHEVLLNALGRCGRIRDGDAHVSATIRLYESEGLDPAPVRNAWRMARGQFAATSLSRVDALPSSAEAGRAADVATAAARRASIAIMPFSDRAHHPSRHADGLVHDVITRLAKLRSLFVIAQGTVFALHQRLVGPEEAGRVLNVDYVVSGTVEFASNRLTIAIELTETKTARIIWAEVFDRKIDDTFLVLDEVGSKIVASIASEVEAAERNRAILKPPNSLNAWEAYHRGLWHMYRFDRGDNERAEHFFEMAVRLDPTFARAYAGLSFTHFQNAFQGWSPRDKSICRAFETAGQSLMADDRDPAAHWAMGRALWLRRQQDQSVVELETAVDLSPNFALGHYTLAFVRSQSGDAHAAIESSDHSRHLSPFDPLLFGMLASRAIALIRLGKFDDAAEWAVKAAARPNAHSHILAIAACGLAMAGRFEEARTHRAIIHKALPHYTVADFLNAFRFDDRDAALFRDAASRIGMG